MSILAPLRLFVVVIVLTFLTIHAWAEPAWRLWVEAPLGSDQWSAGKNFVAKDECDKHAQKLNDFELTMARTEHMTGDSRDLFTCLPDTVDPRPEAALR